MAALGAAAVRRRHLVAFDRGAVPDHALLGHWTRAEGDVRALNPGRAAALEQARAHSGMYPMGSVALSAAENGGWAGVRGAYDAGSGCAIYSRNGSANATGGTEECAGGGGAPHHRAYSSVLRDANFSADALSFSHTSTAADLDELVASEEPGADGGVQTLRSPGAWVADVPGCNAGGAAMRFEQCDATRRSQERWHVALCFQAGLDAERSRTGFGGPHWMEIDLGASFSIVGVRTQRPGMHYGYDVANVHARGAQQPVAGANHSCNASSWDVFAAAAAAAAAAGWN